MDNKLLKKGVALALLSNYIDWQSSIVTRTDASKDSILSTVKTCFNAMLDRGDVEYSDWDGLNTKIKNLKFETIAALKETVNEEMKIKTIEVLCENHMIDGVKLSDSLSVENLKSLNTKTGASAKTLEVLSLVQHRMEIDKLIRAKLEGTEFSVIGGQSSDMVNMYGKYFPEDYLRMVNRALNE